MRLGVLSDSDRAASAGAFVELGLGRLEMLTGSFTGLMKGCEAVYMVGGDGWPDHPFLALGVAERREVSVASLIHRLSKHDYPGAEGSLASWFGLNLHGQCIYGPAAYADMVRMQWWGGEENEVDWAKANEVNLDEYEVYTRKEFINDTAPWIFERAPENSDFWMTELSKFDKALAMHFDRFLAMREKAYGKLTNMDLPDVMCIDAHVFTWGVGHRTTDVYDEYLQYYSDCGVCVDWAWIIPLMSRADIELARLAYAYHSAVEQLSDYIITNYP